MDQIDRETYRKIKKMNRDELQDFLMRYSDNLIEECDKELLDLREVEKDIKAIKGIGAKRAEEIMRIIERHLGVDGK